MTICKARRGSVEEHPLGAVAVVDVDIDDGDACGTMRDQGRRSGNRDVVEQAEPHGAIAFRVMTRRTDERDRRFAMLERMVRSLHSSTSGDERDLERLRRREGIGVERDAAPTRSRYRVNMGRRVDAQQLRLAWRLSARRYVHRVPAIGRRRRRTPGRARDARDGQAVGCALRNGARPAAALKLKLDGFTSKKV